MPLIKPARESLFIQFYNVINICTKKANKRTAHAGMSHWPSGSNARLYCSKVKNLVARFGVSARMGGRIPL